MKQKKITATAIKEYIYPEIESLKALLNNLHLQKSLKALVFLEHLIKLEISSRSKTEIR